MYGLVLVLGLTLCGVCATAVWDAFGALRSAWELKGFAGIVTDLASPVSFAILIWCGILCVADGNTRMYVFLCMGIGIVLYILTVRRWIFKLFFEVFKNIRKIIGFILKILLTPARFLYKMIYVELYTKKRRKSAETEKTANDPKD